MLIFDQNQLIVKNLLRDIKFRLPLVTPNDTTGAIMLVWYLPQFLLKTEFTAAGAARILKLRANEADNEQFFYADAKFSYLRIKEKITHYLQRRKAERFLVQIEVFVSSINKVLSISICRCTDISMGGCFIACITPLAFNEKLLVNFQLPTGTVFSLSASVRYCLIYEGFGVEFIVSPEQAQLLSAFVNFYTRNDLDILDINDSD